MTQPAPLIEFLETHLGPSRAGSRDPKTGIQTIYFDDQPAEASVTLTTLGLSNRVLEREDGNKMRQELLFASYEDLDEWRPDVHVLHVADELAEKQKALKRGQVIALEGVLFPESELEAFYCAAPVYWPAEVQRWEGADPAVVVVWLVPITADEATFIEANGWKAFEELLDQSDPDLFDLRRASMLAE